MPFEEQLRLMRSTNVLVGMHGAGLTFLPLLADDAVVVELNPYSPHHRQRKYHFQNLAAWSGRPYLRWQNEIIPNEIDVNYTRVDPKQFRALVVRALHALRNLHGSRAFNSKRVESYAILDRMDEY